MLYCVWSVFFFSSRRRHTRCSRDWSSDVCSSDLTNRGGSPAWGSQPFPKGDRSGRFVTLASGFDEDEDALPIRSDARVLGATLKAGDSVDYALGADRHGYLVPAIGAVEVNGTRIEARDGAAIADAAVVKVMAIEDS